MALLNIFQVIIFVKINFTGLWYKHTPNNYGTDLVIMMELYTIFSLWKYFCKTYNLREYNWCTSYTYTKQNNETSCNCFRCSKEGIVRGRDGGIHLNNAQCQAIHNCHHESHLYRKYVLIKMGKNFKTPNLKNKKTYNWII
jgi:hypothetical protein